MWSCVCSILYSFLVLLGVLLFSFTISLCVPLCDFVFEAESPKVEGFESLSAMEIAEQISLLDYIVFRSIPYE